MLYTYRHTYAHTYIYIIYMRVCMYVSVCQCLIRARTGFTEWKLSKLA